MRGNRRVWLRLAMVGALLGSSLPAAAFRPSARWLLDQAAQRQLSRGVRTLRVSQESVLFGLPSAPKGFITEERTWFLSPDSMRNEVELPEGTRIHLMTAKKRKVHEPGNATKASSTQPDLIRHFLAAGGSLERGDLARRLESDLKSMRVNLDVVSYGRFDGRVAYVIGAKPWESDKPQVWLDKDSLLLLRIMMPAGQSGTSSRELRLLGYGSPEGGSWFPKVIEDWEGGALRQRSVTRAVDKNEELERALFES
jgi:hypothetical protein